ncbi:hypothetical protein MNBD_BACTEROID01-1310 [hydrothermal vent metagenome]|uniref:ATP synthase protein I n=1 Tax=hydrothermal vent metagenome TaxID=652676 RepID=A0A3B0TRI6_9ZZZZ
MTLQKQNKEKKKFNNFIRYSSLGFEMAAIIVIGTWGGYKLDQWLNNEFKISTLVLMAVSVIISIIYGTKNLLKK